MLHYVTGPVKAWAMRRRAAAAIRQEGIEYRSAMRSVRRKARLARAHMKDQEDQRLATLWDAFQVALANEREQAAKVEADAKLEAARNDAALKASEAAAEALAKKKALEAKILDLTTQHAELAKALPEQSADLVPVPVPLPQEDKPATLLLPGMTGPAPATTV